MVVLNESEKHRVGSLFERSYPSKMWLNGYLQDLVPGITYVDTLQAPEMAIVVLEFHHVSFVGLAHEEADFSDAWNQVLEQEIYLWLVWDPALYSEAPTKNSRGRFARLEFESLNREAFDRLAVAAKEIEGELSPIDPLNFELCESKSENLLAYETKERYLQKTTGLVLRRNGQYVGNAEALSKSASSTGTWEADLQIVVTGDGRRKGFGTKLATALITELLTAGVSPLWSCNADNPPSERLARKLGFSSPRHFEIITYEIEAPFPQYWARVLRELNTTYERKVETINRLQTEFFFTRQEAHWLTVNYLRNEGRT